MQGRGRLVKFMDTARELHFAWHPLIFGGHYIVVKGLAQN
jgi:hypothetical protein